MPPGDENCIGSGIVPLHLGLETDETGTTTGLCPFCYARLALTSDGLVPEHTAAEREIGELPPY
jgi:hypothetical protein